MIWNAIKFMWKWATSSWYAGFLLGGLWVWACYTSPYNMADVDAQKMKEKSVITVGYGDLDEFDLKYRCRVVGSPEKRWSITYPTKEEYEAGFYKILNGAK